MSPGPRLTHPTSSTGLRVSDDEDGWCLSQSRRLAGTRQNARTMADALSMVSSSEQAPLRHCTATMSRWRASLSTRAVLHHLGNRPSSSSRSAMAGSARSTWQRCPVLQWPEQCSLWSSGLLARVRWPRGRREWALIAWVGLLLFAGRLWPDLLGRAVHRQRPDGDPLRDAAARSLSRSRTYTSPVNRSRLEGSPAHRSRFWVSSLCSETVCASIASQLVPMARRCLRGGVLAAAGGGGDSQTPRPCVALPPRSMRQRCSSARVALMGGHPFAAGDGFRGFRQDAGPRGVPLLTSPWQAPSSVFWAIFRS